MGLMNTLVKVAAGVAIAKGIQHVQSNGGFGKVVEDLKARVPDHAGGGLGSLEGIMGQLAGSGSGGLGGLGAILGGAAAARTGDTEIGSSLESLLSQDNPAEEPDEDASAGLMIRAMIMAARSDGKVDALEKEVLMSTIGDDAGDEEMSIVRDAMGEPVDAAALARDVPNGLETQVYAMSVMAITPDNQSEANFLHQLVQALGIAPETANEIHDSFQVPRLYS